MAIEFTRKRIRTGIDMTPMIDCLFQLLVFLFLSTTFLHPAVGLDLPQGKSAKDSKFQGITVTIDAKRQIYLNKESMQLDELETRVRMLLKQAKQPEVRLQADKKLPYNIIFEALMKVRRAGASRVHLSYLDQ